MTECTPQDEPVPSSGTTPGVEDDVCDETHSSNMEQSNGAGGLSEKPSVPLPPEEGQPDLLTEEEESSNTSIEQHEPNADEIKSCLERLQRVICGLSEPAGHPNAVAREFFRAGPRVAVEALLLLHGGLVDGGARGAYMGVLRLFISPKELPYHLKQPMYVYARQKGYLSIAYCFLRPPAQRKRGTGECLIPDPPEGDRTLGERRTLARSLDRHVITRVRRDPDPMVVKNLLRNPRLKEEDVVRIASSRPVRAQVLVDVAHHRTWLNSPKVQLTLALNPYTPTHIAVAILPLLHIRELRDMAGDQNLHLVVREAATYLVNIRTSHQKRRNHEPG